MASVAVQTRLTPEQYLVLERKAATKSEFLSGERITMPGASRKHNLIAGNILTALNNELVERDCEVYTSDMRVRTYQPSSFLYPDVVVVCDEPRFEDDEFDTLLNPTVVVEVLSPSTEAYDRNEKFTRYKQLSSLQEYLLVSQDKVRIEHYLRRDSRWVWSEFRSLEEVLPLVSIQCELPLRAIYKRVRFDG